MSGKEKYEKYLKWCREHSLPAFVPPTNRCFHCHKPVFEDGDDGPEWNSYPTCCPNCSSTFCD